MPARNPLSFDEGGRPARPASPALLGALAGHAQPREWARLEPSEPNRAVTDPAQPVFVRVHRLERPTDVDQLLLLRALSRLVHLALGERVITHGQEKARPGEPVEILAVDDGTRSLQQMLGAAQ